MTTNPAHAEIKRLHTVNRELLASHNELLVMLNRIHAMIEANAEADLWSMFDEIGCLIAKARGDYIPDNDERTAP